jgi:RND family efflux transporter MFP subunit
MCRWFVPLWTALGTGIASAQGVALPVEVAAVETRLINRVVQVTGSVTAARESRLSVATSGLVTALHVDAGTRVKVGDLLLELDPELAQLQWRSARAGAEQARNALTDARRRLQEAEALAPQQSIAETVVRDLAAEVAEDEAALHRAEAEAGYRQGVLERHQLKAPFSGVVSAKLTELGEWVIPGQPVLELVATDQVRLDFQVPEDFLADVATGTPVKFILNADASRVFEGKVATVVPVADPNARTFLLRVHAAAGNYRMLPGMSAQAELALSTGREGLVVPRDAVLRFPDGRSVVWLVRGSALGAMAEERRVETGLAFDGMVEIREGLEDGATVVVQGNAALQEGQQVMIRSTRGD